MRRHKSLVAIMLLGSSLVQAQEPLKIIAYPVAKIAVYDAQGEFVEDLPREQMPKPDVPVLSYDERNSLLLIALPDRQVWIDPLDVKLNRGKTAVSDCRQLIESSAAADKKVKAVMGYSQACGQ